MEQQHIHLLKADTKTTTDNAYPYTYETLYQSVVAGDVNWLYAKVADTVDGSASTTYPDTFDSLHTAVTYTSSDSSVLAVGNVGNNCKVVGVAAGTASIIVTYTINDVSTVVAVLPVTVLLQGFLQSSQQHVQMQRHLLIQQVLADAPLHSRFLISLDRNLICLH